MWTLLLLLLLLTSVIGEFGSDLGSNDNLLLALSMLDMHRLLVSSLPSPPFSTSQSKPALSTAFTHNKNAKLAQLGSHLLFYDRFAISGRLQRLTVSDAPVRIKALLHQERTNLDHIATALADAASPSTRHGLVQSRICVPRRHCRCPSASLTHR